MDTTLSRRADGRMLPPRPPSVCHACWEGPYAMHFGLPGVSPRDGQSDRSWPESYTYRTSLAELKARAVAGCVWCRLLDAALGARTDIPVEITVSGGVTKWKNWSPENVQTISVTFDKYEMLTGFVHTAQDDPAASHIVARRRILEVGSPQALRLAREHIDECVHEHERCQDSASPSPRLPTRVVDCSDPARPRLVSTTRERGEYLALSYVWGGDQAHKTTNANKSTYERGIALSLIPATIRDAIYVTHMLGFRSLWIDSLCIIQDSNKDKLHEIGRMHHIYRYAHLTIIAASAETVSDGFLHDRPPPPQMNFGSYKAGGEVALPFLCPPTSASDPTNETTVQPQTGTVYFTPFGPRGWPYSRDLGRVGTRAWCMQEYMMSPRSLIFTSKTVLLRCLTMTRHVGDSLCDRSRERRLPDTLFHRDPPAAASGSEEWADVHDAWLDLVRDYSGRAASVASDKLLACAAIAEQFSGVLRCEYLAGLWRSDALLTDLLWYKGKGVHNPPRPTEYRAPSWSWAAVEGGISWTLRASEDTGTRVALAEIVECRATPENAALSPFGRVTGGTLVLRGTLLPCRSSRVEEYSGQGYRIILPSLEQARRAQWVFPGLDGSEDRDESIEPQHTWAGATIDCEADEDIERVWAVPLVRTEDQWVYGLVLAMTAEAASSRGASDCEKARFRRIGRFLSLDDFWDALEGAVKQGECPLVDIEIV